MAGGVAFLGARDKRQEARAKWQEAKNMSKRQFYFERFHEATLLFTEVMAIAHW